MARSGKRRKPIPSIDDLLKDGSWSEQLEQARMRRARILRMKPRKRPLAETKPWDSAPVAPLEPAGPSVSSHLALKDEPAAATAHLPVPVPRPARRFDVRTFALLSVTGVFLAGISFSGVLSGRVPILAAPPAPAPVAAAASDNWSRISAPEHARLLAAPAVVPVVQEETVEAGALRLGALPETSVPDATPDVAAHRSLSPVAVVLPHALTPPARADTPMPQAVGATLVRYEAPSALLVPSRPQLGDTPAIASSRLSIAIYVPDGAAEAQMGGVLARMSSAGYSASRTGTVGFRVKGNYTRYFHEEDAAAARKLASLVGATAQDFTHFKPQPAEGTIEVWLEGEGRSRSAVASVRRQSREAEAPLPAVRRAFAGIFGRPNQRQRTGVTRQPGRFSSGRGSDKVAAASYSGVSSRISTMSNGQSGTPGKTRARENQQDNGGDTNSASRNTRGKSLTSPAETVASRTIGGVPSSEPSIQKSNVSAGSSTRTETSRSVNFGSGASGRVARDAPGTDGKKEDDRKGGGKSRDKNDRDDDHKDKDKGRDKGHDRDHDDDDDDDDEDDD